MSQIYPPKLQNFKWKFKDFKKAMAGKRLKRHMTVQDKITAGNMEMMHGGSYWPTTDGGLVAIPDTPKFIFEEWVE